MSYRIDARLEQGFPELTLIDAETGESRLHWRGDGSMNNEASWRDLFKKLMLISCADRIDWLQRIQSSAFGEECVQCEDCSIQARSQREKEWRTLRAYK